jgi:hypothetical protein
LILPLHRENGNEQALSAGGDAAEIVNQYTFTWFTGTQNGQYR